MEIRNDKLTRVEWDRSAKFLHVVRKRKKFKFSVHAFTTFFHRELIRRKNATAFFVYYGFACVYAIALILGIFMKTEQLFNWEGNLFLSIAVGVFSILSSFFCARLTIQMISWVLAFGARPRKKMKRTPFVETVDCEVESQELVRIVHPNQTPFPQELEKKMA